MPTHRDYPWEQDARAARERAPRAPAPASSPAVRRGTSPVAVLLAVVALAAAGLVVVQSRGAEPAVADPVHRVLEVHSSWVPGGGLQAWGTTEAPDGATVTVRAADGSGAWQAPVQGGRFAVVAPIDRREGVRLEAAVTG